MESRLDPQILLLSVVIVLILVSILVRAMTHVPTGASPFSKGKGKLPGPACDTDEEALFRFDLDELLDTREDIDIVFARGGLKGCDNAAETCKRWRQYACRHESVAALALAAALSRLCPESLPDGEAAARQEEVLSLTGEGEGHFLLGLSHLVLYAHFQPKNENTAQDAWRQAVEHFRRSGFAGHQDGMEAAALLCVCGHDLPFAPPESFQEYLPLLKASNTDAQKAFFEALDRCLDVGDISLSMPYLLPFEAGNPAAPEAVFWNLRLAEAGDAVAMHYLATLCAGTTSPGMARAEDWYRRSMEAGNTANAAEVLCQRYLAGELPDETGKKTALCLIVSACTEQCDEEDIPDGQGVRLSAERLEELKERKELAGEIGRRAAAQLEACKAEGEALHARARRNLLARAADRQEENACRLNAARQKLSALCHNPEGGQGPEPQSATAAPARKNRPRRPFARPDKR